MHWNENFLFLFFCKMCLSRKCLSESFPFCLVALKRQVSHAFFLIIYLSLNDLFWKNCPRECLIDKMSLIKCFINIIKINSKISIISLSGNNQIFKVQKLLRYYDINWLMVFDEYYREYDCLQFLISNVLIDYYHQLNF